MIASWVTAGAFAAGLVLGGSVGGAAYWFQGARLKNEQASHLLLQSAVETSNREAESKANAAQLMIDALSSDLAHSRKQREIVYVHVESEIVRYTSPTARALGPDAVRVLNSQADRSSASRADPGRAPGPRPAAAASAGGSASERAVTLHLHKVTAQYYDLQERHSALARQVCLIPNVLCE